MMFGYRDEFTYLECASCGCLANVSVPDDLGKYYGAGYYSMAASRSERGALYQWMKGIRTRAYLGREGLLGATLLKAFGPPALPEWVKRAGVKQDSSILEVGCGSGSLLRSMRSEGFNRLTGVDPFIEHDIDYGNGLRIRKTSVTEMRGSYDYIVLEHSFEHMPEPQATLAALCALLSPLGTLIIAIPLVGYAWECYGVDWVQLDAPRHLYLHTERSLRILAAQANVKVVDVIYDSGAVQFWGSEQYRMDIPLLDARSHRVNPANSAYSPQAILEFQHRAAELNERRLGDQATFLLQKEPGGTSLQ
jgi:SAM-dependent methyltransferase